MQCPDCGYICFKPAKNCGSCGFSFKKANTSTASLFRNESFTILAKSETLEKEQESSDVAPSANSEEIAVMDPLGDSQENPELETGEFLLNLSDAEQESPAADSKPSTSDSDTMDFPSLEFGTNADINLGEVEVEGLGLGLEPLEEEPPIPATSEAEPEENPLEIIEILEADQLAPDDGKTDASIEIAVEEEPDVDIMPSSPSEDKTPEIETNDLSEVSLVESDDVENTEVELELTPTESLEQEAGQVEIESTEPVLDLGEVESPAEPASPPEETDELVLNLEIDDSEGPLSTTNIEIPEIEIEDLGLELEDSDPPHTRSGKTLTPKTPILNRKIGF